MNGQQREDQTVSWASDAEHRVRSMPKEVGTVPLNGIEAMELDKQVWNGVSWPRASALSRFLPCNPIPCQVKLRAIELTSFFLPNCHEHSGSALTRSWVAICRSKPQLLPISLQAVSEHRNFVTWGSPEFLGDGECESMTHKYTVQLLDRSPRENLQFPVDCAYLVSGGWRKA